MFNRNTGKYEYSKLFRSTGALIKGEGNTPEEARSAFKAAKEAYKRQPLVPTGEYVNSPGFVAVEYEGGRVGYEFRADRKAQVLACPQLAEAIKKAQENGKA